ncbi:MAG: hypothetical protein Q7R52_00370 [archaeon]|nr:hypothetical protein [archaeon]
MTTTNFDNLKHGEIINYQHKIIIGNMNQADEQKELDKMCEGTTYWEEGLEGICCTECELYTGVK